MKCLTIHCDRPAKVGKFCLDCYVQQNQRLQIRELEKVVAVQQAQIQILRTGGRHG